MNSIYDIARLGWAFRRGPRRVPASRHIIRPGHYQLDRDITVEDSVGITIACGDVVLDLAGHRIVHAGGPIPGSTGILVSPSEKPRITIQDGTIEGFWRGIHMVGANGSRVIGNTVRNVGYIGIHLSGSDSEVSGNSVFEQRFDLLREPGDNYAIGIQVGGTSLRVKSNTIDNKPPQVSYLADLEFVGILVMVGTRNAVIEGNLIRFSTYLPKSYGVWIGEESHVLVSKNEIRNVQFAVTSDSKDTEVIDNILRNDEMRPETQGVHVPKNVDRSLIAENTIEGFEVATLLRANSTSEADSRRDGV